MSLKTAAAHSALLLAAAVSVSGCRAELEAVASAPPPVATITPSPTFSRPGPTAPVIDGVFDEWETTTLLASDAEGDGNGAFDVTRLHATSRGTRLYLHFDTTTVLNLGAGPESDGTLELQVALPDGRQLSLDFRRRQVSVTSAGSISSYQLGYVASPTHAWDAFEIKLDLEPLGVEMGDTVWIGLAGSDTLEAQPFTFEHNTPLAFAAGDTARPEGSNLRLASLNTYRAGLADGSRRPAMQRLLHAAAADVYVLQELGQTPWQQVADAFEEADPHDDGASWQVLAAAAGSILGNAVVSRSPLVPIATPSPRFIGAVVLLPEAGPVAVFSVHLKCCGYIGSNEDQTRLGEAYQLGHVINKLRAGNAGDSLLPYSDVPVLVAGDFNDVGSPELRELLSMPEQADLLRLPLSHLVGGDVFTWYQAGASFPPGELDLMYYGGGLSARSGFVLDTRKLDSNTLAGLSLQANDSDASDHLMVVADYDVVTGP